MRQLIPPVDLAALEPGAPLNGRPSDREPEGTPPTRNGVTDTGALTPREL
jgi:hypothetical protein